MDTISHITLGAAVGEIVLGKEMGNKAVLWGAVGGLIPDMDILAAPFLNAVDRMVFHRSFSHSITFALLLAPLMGWLLFRLYGGQGASWKNWSRLAFWSVVTHPLLDCFTSYGTQLFWPFSKYRVSLSSVFVIDPLYTVPFAGLLITALLLKQHPRLRRKLVFIGLSLSTFYLLMTLTVKIYVNHIFIESLHAQHKEIKAFLSAPTPFNIILWRGIAEGTDVYWEGFYSLFDKNKSVEFRAIPKHHDWISDLMKDAKIRKLIYISKGYYSIDRRDNAIYFNDLRYGIVDGWMKYSNDYIFSYRISRKTTPDSAGIKIVRVRPDLKINKEILIFFMNRIFGHYSSPIDFESGI